MTNKEFKSKSKEAAYAGWAARRVAMLLLTAAIVLAGLHLLSRAGFGFARNIDLIGRYFLKDAGAPAGTAPAAAPGGSGASTR